MDIDLLSKMVKELILDRDEVTLPGVGTFVAETVPASFSDRGYTINPPYRRLSFRQRQGTGDDSLVNLYVKSNPGVDPEQAEKFVSDFLLEMKEVLKAKKNIVFPGLGRLRSTKENNFFFVADEDLDIWPAGFGLEPISLKAHQETQEEVSAVIRQLKEEILPQEEPVAVEPVEPEEEVESSATAAPSIGLTKEEPSAEEGSVELTAEEKPLAEDEPVEPIAVEPVAEDEPVEPVVVEPVEPVVTLSDSEKSKNLPRWAKTTLWTVISIIAIIAIYAIAARLFPDFFDSILYSREEMEILNF